MKIAGSILALCLFVIFASTALSASHETMLIGKWKYFKGKKIEFIKDGTLLIGDQGAKYRVIDRERIEFDLGMVGMFSDLGPRPVFKFTVSNDELTLIPLAQPNKAEKLRRVKVDALGNDAEVYLNMGINNSKQGNIKQAIKDFDKAIELDPKYALPYFNRGFSYSSLGDDKQAINDYDKAIELDPKFSRPYYNRGNVYFRLGNYEQAIKNYEKTIELDPKLAAYAHYSIACCYSLQNNAQMACQSLKKATEKGFKDWKHLKTDKDFDNIRNTRCFQEIIRGK